MESVSHLGASHALGIDLDEHLIQQATSLSKESGLSEKVDFEVGDFMQDPTRYFADLSERSSAPYGTILLLSITKWLHLHHHDSGLLLLFSTLFNFAPPGGRLIVEPQEWENYKRAVKKNKNLRDNFKGLKMRPDFVEEMEGLGWVLEGRWEREEGGFSRPLLVWRKPE